MTTYDLSNFYNKLKEKFNKSTGKETLLYLLEEFSKTIGLRDERAIIFVGNELSSFLRVKGEVDLALDIYKVINELVVKKYGEMSNEYISLLINIADCDIVNKHYQLAVDKLNKAEKLLKIKQVPVMDEDYEFLLASIYNNRSAAYRELNLLEEAQKDIEESLKLINSEEKKAVSRINLAEIFIRQNKIRKALVNVNKAIAYYEMNNLKTPHLANAYATSANIYYLLKAYDTSIFYYKKAIEIVSFSIGEGETKDLLLKNLDEVKKKRESL